MSGQSLSISPPRRLIGIEPGRYTASLTLVAVLAALTLYPIGTLLYGSLSSAPPGQAGTLDFSGYVSLFNVHTLSILAVTVGMSLLKTVLSLIPATILAWLISRTDIPARGVLELLIGLPFFIPPILTAMGWAMLGNPTAGSINQVWRALTGATAPIVNVYSYGGVVWHLMQFTVPFAFILLIEAFRSMDPSLEESSRTSGAGIFKTFRKVTLALMLPALSSVAILSVIGGIEAFESPLFFGIPAGIHVVTTEIYDSINNRATPNYPYATALSFAVILLMALMVAWQWRLLQGRSFQTISGKAFSPRPIELGSLRWVAFGFCALNVLVFTVLPVLQLVVSSFSQYYGFYGWDMLTVSHYRDVLHNDLFWRSATNTAMLGVVGATLTMILGSVVAYVVVRTKLPFRHLIDLIAWLPWMMPGMVLGLGFLWGFAILPHAIGIYGSLWALLLAYLALGTPLSVRTMSTAFSQLSHDLEESSRVHGASWATTFRKIVVALTLPSFSVGWILTFFMIFRELSASVLLYSIGNEVLPVTVLRLWEEGKAEDVSAIAVMMLVVVLIFRGFHLIMVKRWIASRT
ncbi:MAG: iron ABC transporter permease [Rhizobiales bacterium]|nr:iron ABC transporter permease [Hyphomicrobiales bacterium]